MSISPEFEDVQPVDEADIPADAVDYFVGDQDSETAPEVGDDAAS